MASPTTGSWGARWSASATGTNLGSSIEGMPSFGGPPLRISARSTLALEKSVRGHSARQRSGFADTPAVMEITMAPIAATNVKAARHSLKQLG